MFMSMVVIINLFLLKMLKQYSKATAVKFKEISKIATYARIQKITKRSGGLIH